MMFAGLTLATPTFAATPRETLTNAAFSTRDRASALAQIGAAERSAASILAASPGDREAQLIRAMAIGYQSKLTSNRNGAIAARKSFEALSKSNPRDPEIQAALAGWHLGAVKKLGGFVARAGLGASKATGLAASKRAVALGGNRALFSGLASLQRLDVDPNDAEVLPLAELALRGTTPTPLDSIMKRSVSAVIVHLRAGDRLKAQKIAQQLLPLGRFN